LGAVWSDGGVDEPGTPGPGKALSLRSAFRSIDLRAAQSYDSIAPGLDVKRSTPFLRLGVWLREDDTMREMGLQRFRRFARIVLHTDDTPPRAALAFALGVFIAWTPILGFHTLLALALAFLLGLNRVAVLAGTLVNNPWTIVPIYSLSAYFGAQLLGSSAPAPRLDGVSWKDFGEFASQFQPWIVPLTTGTLILGTLCALLSFPLVLYGIRWYRALRHQAG
jgi:uncharacterized protein